MGKLKDLNYPLGILLSLVIVLNTAIGIYYNIQNIVVLVLLPMLFFLAILFDIRTIYLKNTEILIYLFLVFFALIGIFYYANHQDFETDFRRLIAAFFAAYIPIGLNKNRNGEIWFHVAYVCSIIILITIEYGLGNFSLTGFANTQGLRDRFYFNANYYSYISYFANISLFYLHLRYRNFITLVLTISLPILFLILAFITQSRSGLLLILLINGCFWFFINRIQTKNPINKILRFFFLAIVSVVFIFQFLSYYENSKVQARITSSEDKSRFYLVQEAFNVFLDHPIIGVGLGQFPRYSNIQKFSHNSYVEVLAEHGIIGGFLLLLLFGTPLMKSFRNLRANFENPVLRLNFLFFITFIIYNNAYVFYKFSFSMMYFFLIISYQNKIYENDTQLISKKSTL